MSKEDSIKYVKNKLISTDFNSNKNEINLYNNEDTDEEQNYENENREYYLKTLSIIQQNILEYVEQKSIPLCEYLLTKNIDKILYKKIF